MDTAVLSPMGASVVHLDTRRARPVSAARPAPVARSARPTPVGAEARRAPVRTAVSTESASVAGSGRSASREQAPLRLTTRGRVVVVALGLLLSLGVSMVAARAVADAPVSGGVEVVRHVVVEGETLWALAERVAAPGDDVRDVVIELVRLNGLPSAGLMAGQTIVLPAR
ncbi:LysM peptidoglycan-binding domain-containing protein [Cellulomonas biazotea]|jgi:nucleoid-associated protein YgaU|uniref:LysM domain-containing protein n=1 Tax=Cellulomonas biazotea TaxID=1709 RepID=A0A402DSL3_9CELL|nr:LysM peptidoglycan-binding domain-containing protein [Cellulomonas biazotea]GCE77112.1 hypothetical protein CBZ_21680 [Cellulomonas biazotea]